MQTAAGCRGSAAGSPWPGEAGAWSGWGEPALFPPGRRGREPGQADQANPSQCGSQKARRNWQEMRRHLQVPARPDIAAGSVLEGRSPGRRQRLRGYHIPVSSLVCSLGQPFPDEPVARHPVDPAARIPRRIKRYRQYTPFLSKTNRSRDKQQGRRRQGRVGAGGGQVNWRPARTSSRAGPGPRERPAAPPSGGQVVHRCRKVAAGSVIAWNYHGKRGPGPTWM